MHRIFKNIFAFLGIVLLVGYYPAHAQNNKQAKFYVAFYNTENLFDTVHNPLANDTEFLPVSPHKWNTQKYTLKINHIASVLASMNDSMGPDIAGLAEIENRQVLEDLIHQPVLAHKGYEIMHKDSKDPRGIDVALLYKKSCFEPLNTQWLKVPHPDTTFHTRDILICTARVAGGDTITFVVAHLPSRLNGGFSEENEIKRVYAARAINTFVEEAWKKDATARFFIMGDMNDTPMDESMHMFLYAASKKGVHNISLMEPMLRTRAYTIMFQGRGFLFDQFFASTNNFDTTRHCYMHKEDVGIYKKNWLTYTDKNKTEMPLRTFNPTHTMGYSDHYPIYAVFTLRKR